VVREAFTSAPDFIKDYTFYNGSSLLNGGAKEVPAGATSSSASPGQVASSGTSAQAAQPMQPLAQPNSLQQTSLQLVQTVAS
jgi:hypothetical protein